MASAPVVVRDGWMTKRAQSGKNNWKKRFLRLHKEPPVIRYFTKPDADKPKGEYALTEHCTAEVGEHPKKKGKSIIVVKKPETPDFLFWDGSSGDASATGKWADAVKQVIDSLKPPPPPPPPSLAPPPAAGAGAGERKSLRSIMAVAQEAKARVKRAYAWGANDAGQAGDGRRNETGYGTPQHVEALKARNLPVLISVGASSAMSLTEHGQCFVWGDNSSGMLGLGDKVPSMNRPYLLIPMRAHKLRFVTCGESHALAVTEEGDVHGWGANAHGQLGLGSSDGPAGDKADMEMVYDPTLLPTIGTHAGVPILEVSAGAYHSAALGTDKHTYTWGANGWGQLGQGSESAKNATPGRVQGSRPHICKVSCGGCATALLAEDHTLQVTGLLGTDEHGFAAREAELSVPHELEELSTARVVDVALGAAMALAVAGGRVYSWGTGALGFGDVIEGGLVEHPTALEILDEQRVTSVAVGVDHCAALTKDGRLFTWGANMYGQLGTGYYMDQKEPVRAKDIDNSHYVDIQLGASFSMALVSDGKPEEDEQDKVNAVALKLGRKWKVAARAKATAQKKPHRVTDVLKEKGKDEAEAEMKAMMDSLGGALAGGGDGAIDMGALQDMLGKLETEAEEEEEAAKAVGGAASDGASAPAAPPASAGAPPPASAPPPAAGPPPPASAGPPASSPPPALPPPPADLPPPPAP